MASRSSSSDSTNPGLSREQLERIAFGLRKAKPRFRMISRTYDQQLGLKDSRASEAAIQLSVGMIVEGQPPHIYIAGESYEEMTLRWMAENDEYVRLKKDEALMMANIAKAKANREGKEEKKTTTTKP